jgi:hypothetical protein
LLYRVSGTSEVSGVWRTRTVVPGHQTFPALAPAATTRIELDESFVAGLAELIATGARVSRRDAR